MMTFVYVCNCFKMYCLFVVIVEGFFGGGGGIGDHNSNQSCAPHISTFIFNLPRG